MVTARASATINLPGSPNVQVWTIPEGTEIVYDEEAVDAIFSPDGKAVATINLPTDPDVQVWTIPTRHSETATTRCPMSTCSSRGPNR